MAITPSRNGIQQSTAGTTEEVAWQSGYHVKAVGSGTALGAEARMIQVRCTSGTALVRCDPIGSGGNYAATGAPSGSACSITTTDDWVTFIAADLTIGLTGLFIAGSGAACTCDWRMCA